MFSQSIFFFFFNFHIASWIDVQSRRRFFESFAKGRGLDPLVPETWYTTSGFKYEKVILFLHLFSSLSSSFI